MSEDFEKTDKEWMETLKGVRNQKMPEGLLKNFSAEVEQKIKTRGIQPFGGGMPGLGGVGIFALGLALLLSGFAIWYFLPARKAVVIPVKDRALVSSSLQAGQSVIRESEEKEVSPAMKKNVPKATVQPQNAPLSEYEIAVEIEALRELGVWTDEDEEKVGISLEETFSELELAFEDNTQIPVVPVGAG